MNLYYWLGYHFSRLAGRLFFRFRVIHRERMIQSGPAILAMNHQSFLDPPLAGITCNRAIYFLARRTLLNVPLLGRLLPKLNVIPVDQEGVDRSAIKALIRVLKAGNAALVFPEGSRTLDGNLQPAEPGLGLVIGKTLAPVVPLRASKSAIVMMLVVIGTLALLAVFANVQRFRRGEVETVVVKVATSPTPQPH